jgi:hypothetical protein
MFTWLKRKLSERTFVTTEGGDRVCFLGLFVAHVVPDIDTEEKIVNRDMAGSFFGLILTIAAVLIMVRFRLGLSFLIPISLAVYAVRYISLRLAAAHCIALPRDLSMRLYASLVEPRVLRERLQAMAMVTVILLLACIFEPNDASSWLGLVAVLVLSTREAYAVMLSRREASGSVVESANLPEVR